MAVPAKTTTRSPRTRKRRAPSDGAAGATSSPEIKLKELCRRVGADYDGARYALNRGILPQAVEEDPGRGRHRLFDPGQAFHLGLVLRLNAAGLPMPTAGEIAEWTRTALDSVANRMTWENSFRPFHGLLGTRNRWFVDVGDGHLVRIATTANPSNQDLDELPWASPSTRRKQAKADPVVTVRVDLALLGRLILGETPPPA